MRLQFATVLALVLLTACEPPGKPKAEEAQAENREAILDFKTLFESNCAGCHGDDGKNGPARILNDPLYLAVLPRDTLKHIIIYGRPGTEMPAWAKSQGGPLTDKQVDALVNGVYTNWAKPSNAFSDAPHYTSEAKGDPNHGKQLFARDCFMCHGPGAAIGPVTGPAYLQLVSNQMLRTSIIVGRPDLGMPSYKNLNIGRALADQDVTNLVAYLDSLRTSPAPGVSGVGGEQQTTTGQEHENENGPGQGQMTKGNEGSGFGPGSPRQEKQEGNKGKGSSSQRGVK